MHRNDWLLLPVGQELPSLCLDLTSNNKYWHIYEGEYLGQGWSQTSQLIISAPVDQLYICDNQYEGILREIVHISFPNLLSLSLINDSISSIELVALLKASNLQKLHLSRNKIVLISSLRKAHFPRLNVLTLNDNPIIDLQRLAQCDFPRLQFLFIQNWGESNPLNESNCLLPKLLSQRLSFTALRSRHRIKNTRVYRQINRRYPTMELKVATQ